MIKMDELLLALTGRRPQIAVMENLFIKSKNKQKNSKEISFCCCKGFCECLWDCNRKTGCDVVFTHQCTLKI